MVSRSSSAVSSPSRLPSGHGRVRSLTDDPKLFLAHRTSPSHSNNNVSDNDRTSGDINQTTPTSSVVSLPPVRKTRSNPTAATAHEKVAKPAGPPRQQHTLLNIQKDVEWLAKHQSRQRHNAVQSKPSTISQGEISANIITTSTSHHKGSTHYLNHKQNFTCRVKALRGPWRLD
jgi:hypothetical protein